MSEAYIQALVHEHPACLPIAEIDAMFSGPVPICTELNTPAGPIDNFMVTSSGLPVLVECKLWRNPEGRREVVGQILDYARLSILAFLQVRGKIPQNQFLDLVDMSLLSDSARADLRAKMKEWVPDRPVVSQVQPRPPSQSS